MCGEHHGVAGARRHLDEVQPDQMVAIGSRVHRRLQQMPRLEHAEEVAPHA